jgi:hypothetical protein
VWRVRSSILRPRQWAGVGSRPSVTAREQLERPRQSARRPPSSEGSRQSEAGALGNRWR